MKWQEEEDSGRPERSQRSKETSSEYAEVLKLAMNLKRKILKYRK